MTEKESQDIQTHLQKVVEGRQVRGKELVFDPETGELIVRTPSERPLNPDAAIVDQIAEDGFFGR